MGSFYVLEVMQNSIPSNLWQINLPYKKLATSEAYFKVKAHSQNAHNKILVKSALYQGRLNNQPDFNDKPKNICM